MVTITDKYHVLLVGKEDSFDSPVTAEKDLGLIQSISPSENNNNQYHYGTGSPSLQQITAGKYAASFDITAKYQHGRILNLLFGDPETTAGSGNNDYRHIFVDINDDVGDGVKTLDISGVPFTMEHSAEGNADDYVRMYSGCKVGSISFSCNLQDVLQWSASIIGTSVDSSGTSASSHSQSTLSVLGYYDADLQTGDEDDESSLTVSQDFTINFNANPQEIEGLNSRINQDIANNQLQVTFSFSKVFQNLDEYQRFLGGNSQSDGTPDDTSIIFDVDNGKSFDNGQRKFYCKVVGQYDSHSDPVQLNQAVIASFQGTGKLHVLYTVDNIETYL